MKIYNTGQIEVTYPGIGHFTVYDFRDPVYRKNVLLPQSPHQIDTQFLLYTLANQWYPTFIRLGDRKSVRGSRFVAKKPTKFIIHGFVDNIILGQWMHQLKDQLLKQEDCNVFLVDWKGGNGWPYEQAVANTRVVGPVLGLFINELKITYGLKPSNVHILGHSLGAHIAGYAGQRLNGTIGRITGLDPAGPDFQGLTNPAVKLDPTDAIFVDAIHTNANPLITDFGLGNYDTLGHLDFYPNGGNHQPGCPIERLTSVLTGGPIEGVRRLVFCNHQRSVDFYMASLINRWIKPVGHKCPNYETFKSGKCWDCGPNNGVKCAVMGIHAIQSVPFKTQTQGNRYYLITTDRFPYFQ
ncbi:pancreatic triacylglycerol lipase-like [Oppia nitens]|uniref:pancreatic triacylglycerol lipase-like n=1 Tax=Oppia nitens TaxID=1686743 RepID=UPI0023DA2984|nr:pancreatic triacylglycerol lipase-like [Oppia nitens]